MAGGSTCCPACTHSRVDFDASGPSVVFLMFPSPVPVVLGYACFWLFRVVYGLIDRPFFSVLRNTVVRHALRATSSSNPSSMSLLSECRCRHRSMLGSERLLSKQETTREQAMAMDTLRSSLRSGERRSKEVTNQTCLIELVVVSILPRSMLFTEAVLVVYVWVCRLVWSNTCLPQNRGGVSSCCCC